MNSKKWKVLVRLKVIYLTIYCELLGYIVYITSLLYSPDGIFSKFWFSMLFLRYLCLKKKQCCKKFCITISWVNIVRSSKVVYLVCRKYKSLCLNRFVHIWSQSEVKFKKVNFYSFSTGSVPYAPMRDRRS